MILFAAVTLLVGCKKDDSPAPDPTEQTLLMYLPWSGNLTSFLMTNIEDMKQVIAAGIPERCRVVVYFMSSPTEGRLFELYDRKGIVCEREFESYKGIAFTTTEGISEVLNDLKRHAPAKRYAMTIGSHGMAWLPANPTAAVSAGAHQPLYAPMPEAEYWQQTDANGLPLTRWFGGTSAAHRTDIATLAEALEESDLHMEYILFDNCYMSSIEVAYELRAVADHLIASPCEIMNYGFPYAAVGRHMIGSPNYEAIVEGFVEFYEHYTYEGEEYPYGNIATIHCDEIDALAALMKQINQSSTTPINEKQVQSFDCLSQHRFFDLGDYVAHYSTDEALKRAFAAQLERVIPASHRAYTPKFYSSGYIYTLHAFSGISTSDPSRNSYCDNEKKATAWWKATH